MGEGEPKITEPFKISSIITLPDWTDQAIYYYRFDYSTQERTITYSRGTDYLIDRITIIETPQQKTNFRSTTVYLGVDCDLFQSSEGLEGRFPMSPMKITTSIPEKTDKTEKIGYLVETTEAELRFDEKRQCVGGGLKLRRHFFDKPPDNSFTDLPDKIEEGEVVISLTSDDSWVVTGIEENNPINHQIKALLGVDNEVNADNLLRKIQQLIEAEDNKESQGQDVGDQSPT